MEIPKHPGADRRLKFKEASEGSVGKSRTCHKCKQPIELLKGYYKCSIYGCRHYIHKECINEPKDLPHVLHPLHPQHPLLIHDNGPCTKTFVCSLCGENRESRSFLQCTQENCDFYLDDDCQKYFKSPSYKGDSELHRKSVIRHPLHENHPLFPSNTSGRHKICVGCGDYGYDKLGYTCGPCYFYLHIECAQFPTEVVDHPSHPHHPLELVRRQSTDQEPRCSACLFGIKGQLYLRRNHCATTFNLDIPCYFRFFEPTFKHEVHQHPLLYFYEINGDDANSRCFACNIPCRKSSFRCLTCNFNTHPDCSGLPFTVDYYDHVHPLTLTPSFKDDHPTTYYCNICEKRRDPDHGIYLCTDSECSFIAHFGCALSLDRAETKYKCWYDKVQDEKIDDNHGDEEDMLLANKNLCQQILDKLNRDIQNINNVMEQLSIEKAQGRHITNNLLMDIKESHKKTDVVLGQLKQRFSGTHSN